MANSESAPPPTSKARIDEVWGDMNDIIGIISSMGSENEFNTYLNQGSESIIDVGKWAAFSMVTGARKGI